MRYIVAAIPENDTDRGHPLAGWWELHPIPAAAAAAERPLTLVVDNEPAAGPAASTPPPHRGEP